MEKNIVSLAKYLLSKGIDSPLRIQKILFFLRFEELKENSKTKSESYFNKENNFQAWIYGPVNERTFYYLQTYFQSEDEKEAYILNDEDIKEIDKIYGKWFNKYKNKSASWLINESHRNKSWINARGNLGIDEICREYLKEDETFIQFE